jgi:hypothetical protein
VEGRAENESRPRNGQGATRVEFEFVCECNPGGVEAGLLRHNSLRLRGAGECVPSLGESLNSRLSASEQYSPKPGIVRVVLELLTHIPEGCVDNQNC